MKNQQKEKLNQKLHIPDEKIKSINNTILTNDVSFSLPDWKQQEINNINEQYEKDIYKAVPLSLTDFDSKEQVQFLSEPQKCLDQRYAYERKLLHSSDFCILTFILCFEQMLIADPVIKPQKLQKFKKTINELQYCQIQDIPIKMRPYYENKIIKKILFQYINKGSYNVSLLEVLLRRNSVLKFALSLVSKAILFRRGVITSYTEMIPPHIQMRNCGDEFGVLSTIKVREKILQTQNFQVQIGHEGIRLFRRQNLVSNNAPNEQKTQKKIQRKQSKADSLQSSAKLLSSTRYKQLQIRKFERKNTSESLQSRSSKKIQKGQKKQSIEQSAKIKPKRSGSLINFFRRVICF